MAKRRRLLFFLLIPALVLTGCWDQVQIEERGFVIGVSVDIPKSPETEQNAEEEAPDKPQGRHRFVVTNQFVIPGGLTGGGGGSQGGGTQNASNEAFLNLTSEGDSLFEISRELATRTSRSPFYQHMKVLILSEEIAKRKLAFANCLDFFLRDPELRRSSKIMIAKGDARPVLEVKPKTEKLPAMYINSVAENIRKSARMLPEVRIGEVHEYLVSGSSFILPRIVPDKNEVKIAGAAVFRGSTKQMIGYLGEEETEGLNFLTGKVEGGLLKVPVKDNLVMINVQGARRQITANTSDKERIRFVITIEMEGAVAESFERLDFLEEKTIENLETAVAREIERLTTDTIKKVHKEMKTDVIGLGSHLKQKDKKLWDELKKDWDAGRNYFAKSEIQVIVKSYIRNFGDVNKTEK